jgi:hypothetical protein
VDGQVVSQLLPQRLPQLWAHISTTLAFPDLTTLFLPRWMLCVFLNCFAADVTARVWDVLFLEVLAAAEGPAPVALPGAPPLRTGAVHPAGAGPRFMVELCLATLSVCQKELLSAASFPEAVDVLKAVGERVRDAAELLLLTRHPQCSLRGGSMLHWRTTLAGVDYAAVCAGRELLRGAWAGGCGGGSSGGGGGAAAAAAPRAPPAAPRLLSPCSPPVDIGASLGALFPALPLSPGGGAGRRGGAASPRPAWRSPLALAALESGPPPPPPPPLPLPQPPPLRASILQDIAAALNPVLASAVASAAVVMAGGGARKRGRGGAAEGTPGGAAPASAAAAAAPSPAAFASAFSSAARSAASKLASDAALAASAASRLARGLLGAAPQPLPYPTAYEALDPTAEAVALSPEGRRGAAEEAKRARHAPRGEENAAAPRAGGGKPLQLLLLSPPRPTRHAAGTPA